MRCTNLCPWAKRHSHFPCFARTRLLCRSSCCSTPWPDFSTFFLSFFLYRAQKATPTQTARTHCWAAEATKTRKTTKKPAQQKESQRLLLRLQAGRWSRQAPLAAPAARRRHGFWVWRSPGRQPMAFLCLLGWYISVPSLLPAWIELCCYCYFIYGSCRMRMRC